MTPSEIEVVRCHATQEIPEPTSPEQRVRWATDEQSLIAQGMLVKGKEGVIVTPEGLAMLLGVPGIPAPSATSAADSPGAAKPRSKAVHKSEAQLSRQARARN